MKVLVIHTVYRFKGGEDTVVFNEIKLLQSAGIEVESLQFLNEGQTLLKVLQMPFNYRAYQLTVKKIKESKPDIVHIHNLHFGGSPSVIYAIKRCKIPFVATLHNYRLLCPSATLFANGKIFTPSVNQLFPLQAILKGVYLNSKILTFWVSLSMLFHQLLGTWKLSSKYIALGEHSKQLFIQSKLKLPAERIVVKPNFCYPVEQPATGAAPYYLYVGRLSEEKGLNVLLNAFATNMLPLKIAGLGPLQKEVERYSEKYANIIYLGSVDKEEVYTLLKNATALLFPSLWYETFGMVVIEAFSACTPVFASNLGQMKNLVTHNYNGLLVEPGNAADLGRQLTFFEDLSEPNRLQYRKNARRTYEENFTPERNLKELVSIYDEALSNYNFIK